MPNLDANGRPRPPKALTWDHTTHDYKLDADGLYIESHPVDAAVDLALTVRLGSLPSAPDVGHALSGISPVGPRRDAEARSAVRKALQRLTQRGDITILDIVVDGTDTGLLYVAVSYQNNRLRREPGQPGRTVEANI